MYRPQKKYISIAINCNYSIAIDIAGGRQLAMQYRCNIYCTCDILSGCFTPTSCVSYDVSASKHSKTP
jgi:hypothetical protein